MKISTMSQVKELQDGLVRMIYAVSDATYLRRVKSELNAFIKAQTKEVKATSASVWSTAVVHKLSRTPTVKQVVEDQEVEPILFTDLIPLMDNCTGEPYDFDDLMSALD